jgi:hypothetical protein
MGHNVSDRWRAVVHFLKEAHRIKHSLGSGYDVQPRLIWQAGGAFVNLHVSQSHRQAVADALAPREPSHGNLRLRRAHLQDTFHATRSNLGSHTVAVDNLE